MRSLSPERLAAFLQALPKTETHLHIEGALPYDLLQTLDPQKFAAEPASFVPGFKYRDFGHFEEHLLGLATQWFTSPERYFEAAKLIMTRLVETQQVKYLETSFASGAMDFLQLDGREVLDAIHAAKPDGLELRVFMGVSHDSGSPFCQRLYEQALGWEDLAGFDLHGPEDLPIEEWTAPLWADARAAGKFNKCHAGEFLAPDYVRRMIDLLEVTRIEHGIRSVEDPALLAQMAKDGVACDVCPISNVRLAPTVKDFKTHPIHAMRAAGVTCTVSTDDPLVFGNSLADEYTGLAVEAGYSFEDLADCARAGFQVALLDADARARNLAEIDRVLAAYQA